MTRFCQTSAASKQRPVVSTFQKDAAAIDPGYLAAIFLWIDSAVNPKDIGAALHGSPGAAK